MIIASGIAAASYETLKVDVTNEVLTLTINRPKALNALSRQVISDLRDAVSQLRNSLGKETPDGTVDWSIRGLIITGAGDKSFVAGGDITEMSAMTADEVRQYAGQAQELTSWLEELPVPVIAAVNGFALGGGSEMALACDMIFAAEDAWFGQPEVALGLIPGFGGTVRLQKVVGPQLAADLIYSGRRINAEEAKTIGLASRVYESDSELLAGTHKYFESVRAQSPIAVATAKRTVREVAHLSISEGLKAELDAFTTCFTTDDMREGTSAFVEKRKPTFTGK